MNFDINFVTFRSDSKPDSSNKSECSSQGQSQNYDLFKEQQMFRNQQQLGNREIQNLINSHLEANKIGRHIADTVLVEKKEMCDIESSQSFTQHDVKTEVEKI